MLFLDALGCGAGLFIFCGGLSLRISIEREVYVRFCALLAVHSLPLYSGSMEDGDFIKIMINMRSFHNALLLVLALRVFFGSCAIVAALYLGYLIG